MKTLSSFPRRPSIDSGKPLPDTSHRPTATLTAGGALRPKLLTPRQLCALYPIKPRTLKHWIHHSAPRHVSQQGHKRTLPGNGLAPALIRKGRLVFIDEDLFLAWLYNGNPPR
ncbi:MAG TPA: hypothetical protein VHQ90_09435 [Thermoanaerobaculia bacterium]|nr:hypothetical protein [Thermoanaerobaculia bacterium]